MVWNNLSRRAGLALGAGLFAFSSMAYAYTTDSMGIESADPVTWVKARMFGKSGSKLFGYVSLSEVEGGVRIEIQVRDAPSGEHGAHIHETGDCSADDGTSAGGHFNPGGHDHGLPGTEPRHLGDLGNIKVSDDGLGAHYFVIKGANLKKDDPKSLLGRAVIVHAKIDDGGQPTGNAGGRIGCAAIPSEPDMNP